MREIEGLPTDTSKFLFSFIGYSDIASLIRSGKLKIAPFVPESLSCDKIDLRINDEFVRLKKTTKVFNIKTKKNYSIFFEHEKNSEIVIYPNERVLMCTIEKLQLPTDIIGIVGLKSTFSRLGLQANMGLIDPGFSGRLTLEVLGSSFPICLYAGESIFHVAFASLKPAATQGYMGKYRNQNGPTLPRFHCDR